MEKVSYSTSVVVGFQVVEIVEMHQVADGSQRILAVRVSGEDVGECQFVTSIYPKIAFNPDWPSYLVLYGNTDIYLLDIEVKSLSYFHHSEVVHELYKKDDLWWIVADTSVAGVDLKDGSEYWRHYHDDIILESWWVSGRLLVKDLQNRIFELDPSRLSDGILPTE